MGRVKTALYIALGVLGIATYVLALSTYHKNHGVKRLHDLGYKDIRVISREALGRDTANFERGLEAGERETLRSCSECHDLQEAPCAFYF